MCPPLPSTKRELVYVINTLAVSLIRCVIGWRVRAPGKEKKGDGEEEENMREKRERETEMRRKLRECFFKTHYLPIRERGSLW